MLNIGLPVRVGGLTVETGELLHGDANGVTQIPKEIAAEVADITDEFMAAESIVMDYVKSDEPKSIDEFHQRMQAMGETVQALRARVSRASS